MSSSTVEEQHAPPSSWAKVRNFLSFGSKKQGSQQKPSESCGTEIHERIDDDAQHQAGPGPEPDQRRACASALSNPPQAPTAPVTEVIINRRSQDSTRSAPEVDGVIQVAKDDEEIGEDQAVIEFLHKGAPYFWLHNHFAIPVYYDNIRYPTSEHLFQTLKFPHRPEIAKAVRKAETPLEAVRTARKHAADVRKGWRQEGLNIIAMREVLILKFSQHSNLKKRLLQTGDAELVLASPSDVFWGAGRSIGASKTGLGRNELGKALMHTRDTLLTSAGLGWGSAARTV